MSNHLFFALDVELGRGKKTDVWLVESAYGNGRIGLIKWWAHWRQYVFFPQDGTL